MSVIAVPGFARARRHAFLAQVYYIESLVGCLGGHGRANVASLAYSYLSASTGSSFAAFMAGQTPKIRPMLTLTMTPVAAAQTGTIPGHFSVRRISITKPFTRSKAIKPPA